MADEGVGAEVKTEEQPAAGNEVERLKSELAAATKERDEARQEAKAHQSNVTKKDRENQKLFTRISDLEQKIGLLAEGLDARYNGDDDGEKPALKARLSDLDAKRAANEARELAIEADTLTTEAGLSMKDSRFSLARDFFNKYGDPARGLEEVKRVLAGITNEEPKMAEQKTVDETALRAQIEKEVMEKHGLLTPEGNVPAGNTGHYTSEQVSNMSDDEYRKNRADILASLSAGRFKKK